MSGAETQMWFLRELNIASWCVTTTRVYVLSAQPDTGERAMLAICRNKKMDFSKLKKSTLGTCWHWGLWRGLWNLLLGAVQSIPKAATCTDGLRASLETSGQRDPRKVQFCHIRTTHSKWDFLCPKDGIHFNWRQNLSFLYSARPFYAANILDILLLNYGN